MSTIIHEIFNLFMFVSIASMVLGVSIMINDVYYFWYEQTCIKLGASMFLGVSIMVNDVYYFMV